MTAPRNDGAGQALAAWAAEPKIDFGEQLRREAVTYCEEVYHPQFDAGRSFALFEAADMCGRLGLQLPDWVVAGIAAGVQRVRNGARTLDQAFGRPHKKGEHLGKDAALMWRVWWHVVEDPEAVIDDDYFAGLSDTGLFLHASGKRAGKRLSGITLRRMYNRAERLHHRDPEIEEAARATRILKRTKYWPSTSR